MEKLSLAYKILDWIPVYVWTILNDLEFCTDGIKNGNIGQKCEIQCQMARFLNVVTYDVN